jgi:hypothetical protein
MVGHLFVSGFSKGTFHGGPGREPGGVPLLGLLREKKSIPGFLPWTRRPLRLSLGAIWNLGKGTELS